MLPLTLREHIYSMLDHHGSRSDVIALYHKAAYPLPRHIPDGMHDRRSKLFALDSKAVELRVYPGRLRSRELKRQLESLFRKFPGVGKTKVTLPFYATNLHHCLEVGAESRAAAMEIFRASSEAMDMLRLRHVQRGAMELLPGRVGDFEPWAGHPDARGTAGRFRLEGLDAEEVRKLRALIAQGRKNQLVRSHRGGILQAKIEKKAGTTGRFDVDVCLFFSGRR